MLVTTNEVAAVIAVTIAAPGLVPPGCRVQMIRLLAVTDVFAIVIVPATIAADSHHHRNESV